MTHPPAVSFVDANQTKGTDNVEEWDREYHTRVCGAGQVRASDCPRARALPQQCAQGAPQAG